MVETLALMLSIPVVVVPPVTLSPSHAAVSVSVHVKVPPVGLDTVMGLASGEGPPCTPEKLKLVGLRKMLGVAVLVLVGVTPAPATLNVTRTALLCEPMVMQTVPL